MSKFRLKLARQRGEQIAKTHGFNAFPIDPFRIADEQDDPILVRAKDTGQDGVSGCIIFNDDGVGIIYSKKIRNQGFQRFTVAHELGHYFLDGHPEEILKTAPVHFSRAGFTQGHSSIEIEADHFASGLLMPTQLVRHTLQQEAIGLAGINVLSLAADSSLTSAAIRAAECAPYPMAIIVSQGSEVRYRFLSESFKGLGRLHFLQKGDALPGSATLAFNSDGENVRRGASRCSETNLAEWFGVSPHIRLDEEIVGLGRYGCTLTVLSSEALTENPYEQDDEEEKLIDSWTPKFAHGR